MNKSENMEIQVRWYEKLHSWDKALGLYKEKLEVNPRDQDCLLGQMRCLEALGEWGSLHNTAEQSFEAFTDDNRQRAGKLAAAAAWGLQHWESMERYVKIIPRDSQDGAFYRAIMAVHKLHYDEAQYFINLARDLLDTELTAMAGESYQRAYGAMVFVQMLSELEEVIQYKIIPERRPTLRAMWTERLQAGQKLAEDWQKIIQVHSLVLSPQEDTYTWLKYASICRKAGSFKLSHKTLVHLMGYDPSEHVGTPLSTIDPLVTFAYCKHLWTSGQKMYAYEQLTRFFNDFYQQGEL